MLVAAVPLNVCYSYSACPPTLWFPYKLKVCTSTECLLQLSSLFSYLVVFLQTKSHGFLRAISGVLRFCTVFLCPTAVLLSSSPIAAVPGDPPVRAKPQAVR